MKRTKIPISPNAIQEELGWTQRQLHAVLGAPVNFPLDVYHNAPNLERLARIAPYFKMYRSNPDWNL